MFQYLSAESSGMHCSDFVVKLEGYLLACSLKKKAKRKGILSGCRPAVKGCSCEESHYTAGHCSEEPCCEGCAVVGGG